MNSAAGRPDSARSRARSSLLGGLAAALFFLAVWTPLHPALPQQPTGDIFTHLSVARHLCRGEGFVTDMTYPLSFAFPFAQKLPQPLIHRDPGFPLLMTIPHLAANGKPEAVLAAARILQLVLLGLTIWIGATAFLAGGRVASLLPWLILLAANPFLPFATSWGFIELSCGLLLFLLWLRTRDGHRGRKWSGLLDGLLAGTLVLLRMDLFWVPLVWWIALRPANRPRTLLAILVVVLMMAPWAVRNQRLTGQPFFSVQSQAELVKGIPAWPGYSVYRQLEPQPILKAVRDYPLSLLHKSASGIKFQILNLHRFLPGWYWAGLGILALLGLAGRWKKLNKHLPWTPDLILAGDQPRPAPLAALVVTLGLMILQYSFFDFSLRHLFVLLPVLTWELAPWTGEIAPAWMERRMGSRLAKLPGTFAFLVAPVLTMAGLFLFPCHLPGWEGAAREAEESVPKVKARVELARQSGDSFLFVEYSAVPYFVDRPGVWDPIDPADRDRIRELLSR